MTRGRYRSSSRLASGQGRAPLSPRTASGGPGVTPASILQQAARRLADRLTALESRLDSDGDPAWRDYVAAVRALAAVAPLLSPGQARLLTTAEMAVRLGISPKTLRRRKAMGLARPALQHGRLLRWRADQDLR